jgi:hypothetical protein
VTIGRKNPPIFSVLCSFAIEIRVHVHLRLAFNFQNQVWQTPAKTGMAGAHFTFGFIRNSAADVTVV